MKLIITIRTTICGKQTAYINISQVETAVSRGRSSTVAGDSWDDVKSSPVFSSVSGTNRAKPDPPKTLCMLWCKPFATALAVAGVGSLSKLEN